MFAYLLFPGLTFSLLSRTLLSPMRAQQHQMKKHTELSPTLNENQDLISGQGQKEELGVSTERARRLLIIQLL